MHWESAIEKPASKMPAGFRHRRPQATRVARESSYSLGSIATMRHMDDSSSIPRSGKAPIQAR